MRTNDFGKKYLTEQCQKIRLSDFIEKTRKQIKEAMLQSFIEAEGCNIPLITSKTGFGGSRYWFSCPTCHKRVGVLFKHPANQILGCRQCLRLDYRKHRYGKMIENSV